MVRRWVFTDPYLHSNDPDYTYTVAFNPREMTSLWPTKRVTARMTTAVTGQALVTEGAAMPTEWTFKGTIFDQTHHDALLRWVNKRNRITIVDHYGRTISAYLTRYDVAPKRSLNVPWRHEYTISALVFSVGPAAT